MESRANLAAILRGLLPGRLVQTIMLIMAVNLVDDARLANF
jgi:hypothetical protein